MLKRHTVPPLVCDMQAIRIKVCLGGCSASQAGSALDLNFKFPVGSLRASIQKIALSYDSYMNLLQALLNSDPYVSLGRLGRGAYGTVDRVEKRDRPGIVYARKTVRISGRNGQFYLQAAQNEARILRRLNHRHVVKMLEIYSHGSELSMIMLQVADTDMEQYLEFIESDISEEKREKLKEPLIMWPGCLIQAIDYLHEMRIKHKDLKPANILIKDSHILIADFGISKNLIDEVTTKTLNDGPRGTPMYMAPEVAAGEPRGRAADIFSLGCIFLELATVIILPLGSLARFAEHRGPEGSRRFSQDPMKLVQWIWHLWVSCSPQNQFLGHGAAISDLSFLMLDPDATQRITSRQLVSTIHAAEMSYCETIKRKSCMECANGTAVTQTNLPHHSVYKEAYLLVPLLTPEAALTTQYLSCDWEGVKRLWLREHMWWDNK